MKSIIRESICCNFQQELKMKSLQSPLAKKKVFWAFIFIDSEILGNDKRFG